LVKILPLVLWNLFKGFFQIFWPFWEEFIYSFNSFSHSKLGISHFWFGNFQTWLLGNSFIQKFLSSKGVGYS